MAELSGWLESLARDAEQVACFRGFSLIAVKDFVEVALAQIGKEGIFWQYTDHSIRHIDAIVKLAEEILTGPEGLTPADALLITLALYFHDLGMVVTKAEFESRGETDFLQVKESLAEQYVANGKSDEVNGPDFERHAYEEYVRRNHAARIRNWVSGKNPLILGDAGNVVEAIEKLLAPLDPKFREHLGIVCESHHLDDLDNFAKYPVRYRYGATPREEGNVQFAALVLRTADLLHATRDRTPSIAFTIIAPTHPFSIMEWRKQQGVVSINAVPQRDALGNVDRSKASNTIGVTARFDDPDVFFSFTQYLDYVRRQVRQSYKWAELARLKEGARHTYAWQYIDDSFVEIPGYLRHDSRFSLDQDRILSLLTGHTLYNNSAVAVREVMQNAIDAVRLQQLMKEDPKNASIDVAWDAESRYLAFRDKGTGMSREIINEFLLNVGRSRYQERDPRELPRIQSNLALRNRNTQYIHDVGRSGDHNSCSAGRCGASLVVSRRAQPLPDQRARQEC